MNEGSSDPDPSDLYASVEMRTCDLANGERVVRSEWSGASRVLPSRVADLVQACRGFKTLQDHGTALSRIASARGEDPAPDAILRILTGLAREGLLVSWKNVMSRVVARSAETPTSVTTLAVVGRERTGGLPTASASYLKNARDHGRTLRLVVQDGCRNPAELKETRSRLAALRSEYGRPVSHGGPDEKDRFARELARCSGLPPERVAFALGNPFGLDSAGGADRNALLLETAGEMIVSVDESTLCRVALPPAGTRAGLRFGTGDAAVEEWFHERRETALAFGTDAETDFCGLHEEFLGRNLRDCAKRADPLNLDGLSEAQWLALSSGEGRIGLTLCGLRGGVDEDSFARVVTRSADTRERLVRAKETYRRKCSTREIARSVLQPTVTDRALFPMIGAGMDNRDLMPPFLPVLRREDVPYRLAFTKCCAGAHSVHLPWLLTHAPTESPSGLDVDTAGTPDWGFADDVLGVCLRAFAFGAVRPPSRERMKLLGAHLVDLASLPLEGFEEVVRRLLWKRDSESLLQREHLLEGMHHEPDYWAQDVRRGMEALRDRMIRDDYAVPRDLQRPGTPPEAARDLSRQLLLGYGRLLEDWPVLVDASRELRARGISPASPV